MNMYSEITPELFRAIDDISIKPYKVENLEHCLKIHKTIKGTQFLIIENFLSFVTQYYARDINA